MITEKQYLKALKKRVDADLIISKYNLQQSKKFAHIMEKAKEIQHTFKNDGRTDNEALTLALKYVQGICTCEKPLVWSVLSTKCSRCKKLLKSDIYVSIS